MKICTAVQTIGAFDAINDPRAHSSTSLQSVADGGNFLLSVLEQLRTASSKARGDVEYIKEMSEKEQEQRREKDALIGEDVQEGAMKISRLRVVGGGIHIKLSN